MPNDSVRSICRSCHGGCGVILTLDASRERISVAGDPANPNNHGFLCAKGRAVPDLVRHPGRLTRPLRRVGRRGEGKFVEIEWDEALNIIANQVSSDVISSGPESIILAQGTDRNYQEWLFRFANSLGTPNVIGPANICFYPRVMAGILTMGAFSFVDYEGCPDLVLLWGSNKPATNGDGVIGIRLLDAIGNGTRLVVVDPVSTSIARRSMIHLQLRPGTDAALALGIINQIFELGLIDNEFVTHYTTGVAALRKHVQNWTASKTANICGVPEDDIREAARLYGQASRAGIELGTGAQQSRDSFATSRLLVMLSGLCGNIDVPGGDVLWDPPGIIGRRAMPAADLLPAQAKSNRLVGRHHILGMSGWAHPSTVFDAILTGEPYMPRSLLVFGSNLLVSYADSDKVERALSIVPFLMVADLFLTPTAKYADIVLPVTSWAERDQIVEHANYVASRNAVLPPLGDAKSDEDILNELAKRLGLKGFWGDPGESLDARLAPIGLDWHSLRAQQYLPTSLRYYKYKQNGFATRNGKFIFDHPGLVTWGFASMPVYSDPGQFDPDSPLILTSRHSSFYFNSEFRQIRQLRNKEPFPIVEISPQAAAERNLSGGDWAAVVRGDRSAFFKVKVSERIRPDTVCVSASWWYPEIEGPDAWRLSNVNLLTDETWSNDEMGSSNLRGCRCEVRTTTPKERDRISAALGIAISREARDEYSV